MWRQNGDRDLLRKIDTLSKQNGDQAGATRDDRVASEPVKDLHLMMGLAGERCGVG